MMSTGTLHYNPQSKILLCGNCEHELDGSVLDWSHGSLKKCVYCDAEFGMLQVGKLHHCSVCNCILLVSIAQIERIEQGQKVYCSLACYGSRKRGDNEIIS